MPGLDQHLYARAKFMISSIVRFRRSADTDEQTDMCKNPQKYALNRHYESCIGQCVSQTVRNQSKSVSVALL